MSKFGSDKCSFFLIDGYDIVGTLTNFEDIHEAILEESHTLGDAWAEHSYVGLRQGTITQEGFYDDEALSAHDALSSGVSATGRIFNYCLEGTATGINF